MTTNILASEILAHTTAPRALKVGDLAVFETYTRKLIGCRIARMWAAGEISSTAQIEVQVIGDQGCYRSGAKFTVDATIVTGAV